MNNIATYLICSGIFQLLVIIVCSFRLYQLSKKDYNSYVELVKSVYVLRENLSIVTFYSLIAVFAIGFIALGPILVPIEIISSIFKFSIKRNKKEEPKEESISFDEKEKNIFSECDS